MCRHHTLLILLVLSFSISAQILGNALPRFVLPIVVGDLSNRTNASASTAAAAPASASAHLDRGDANLSGTISSIAVLASLAAQLSIAARARLHPGHRRRRMSR